MNAFLVQRLAGHLRLTALKGFVVLMTLTVIIAETDEGTNAVRRVTNVVPTLREMSRQELCKTPEGRQFLYDNFDSGTLFDLRAQWEGSLMNNQPVPATFEEYVRAAIVRQCEGVSDYTWTLPPPPKVSGTCSDPKIEAPWYDVEETVEKAQAIDVYYRSSTNSDAGTSSSERIRKRDAAILLLLAEKESDLTFAYRSVRCLKFVNASCAGHTGQVKVCDPTYLHAPPDWEFVPGSLKAEGAGIKKRPVLISPTVATFTVGKTGHGENFAFMEGEVMLTEKAVKRRAVADIDVIRREFILLGFPVDKAPAPVVPKPSRPLLPKPTPREVHAPANIRVKGALRPGSKTLFDVVITNSGGSPVTVYYKVEYFDGFFTTPSWKTCQETLVTVLPGQSHTKTCQQWRALEWRPLRWNIVSVN